MNTISNILLSICIPTYNRAEVLDRTLELLIQDPDFADDKIEIIVSDNNSPDNTSEIVKKYHQVKYFKNSINKSDENFLICLNYGTGKYLKLFNDTVRLKKGMLGFMLNKIAEHKNENCNLFFYLNTHNRKNCLKKPNCSSEFLEEVTFYATWIANFGSWKTDFDSLEDKSKCLKFHFAQVDWSYCLVKKKKLNFIYFNDYFEIAESNYRDRYNIFKVFIDNYLSVLKISKFSIYSIEIEKYNLFRYFIYPWMLKLLVKTDPQQEFEVNNSYRILLKQYWYQFYIYPFILKILFKRLLYRLTKSNHLKLYY